MTVKAEQRHSGENVQHGDQGKAGKVVCDRSLEQREWRSLIHEGHCTNARTLWASARPRMPVGQVLALSAGSAGAARRHVEE